MLFRITQEAIHNTLKHSEASQLSISLKYSGQNFSMSIADNGKGFNKEHLPASKGMGMSSMHHRIRLIGGNLQINSFSGQGTTIMLSLPAGA
jgi:signal transduction histidine kinase